MASELKLTTTTTGRVMWVTPPLTQATATSVYTHGVRQQELSSDAYDHVGGSTAGRPFAEDYRIKFYCRILLLLVALMFNVMCLNLAIV